MAMRVAAVLAMCSLAATSLAGLVRDVPTEMSPPVDDIQADMPVSFSKTVEGALKTLEIARGKNTKLQEGIPAQIQTEIDATAKWIEEGHGIDNTERKKNKAALAGALGDRVKGLQAFLGKLKNMRKRLREHIIRVNEAFTSKNLENRNAMRAAKAATRGSTGLKMLMLPAVDKLSAEDRAEMAEDERDSAGSSDGGDSSSSSVTEAPAPASNATDGNATEAAAAAATATSFLEVAVEPTGNTDLEAAKKLAAVANKLYDQVIANVRVTRADLEIERSILGAFRDKLRAMILKREAKLKKLQAQLKALNKAIAAGGSFAEDVWPLLEAHMKVLKEWKDQAPLTAKEADAAELKVITAIKTGKQPAAPAAEADAPATADNATAPADGEPASGFSEAFKEDPKMAKQVTLAVSMAVGGFKPDGFGEGPKKALASTLAKVLSLPATASHVQSVGALDGDENAVKALLSLRLGELPADSVKMKITAIRDDPAPFLEKLRAAGAAGAKAITVMGDVKTVEEAEHESAALSADASAQ